MNEQILEYSANGQPLRSSLYLPQGDAPAPGILVFPDIMGLGDHAKDVAEKLAKLGYAALAADYHGDGRILPFSEAMSELEGFMGNPAVALARGHASLQALRDHPRVDATRAAAIGYCYGGTLALEMARSGAPLDAVVGFHSGLMTAQPDGAKNIRGRVLACIGADDPHVPQAQRLAFETEMGATKVDWQLHVYGGVVHTFTDWRADAMGAPEVLKYDANADKRSWAAMLALLQDAWV